MRFDASCPIEMLSVEFASVDRGRPRAYIKLFSLARREVTGISGTVFWSDASGHTEKRDFKLAKLEAEPRSEFTISLSPDEIDAVRADIVFLEVAFGRGAPKWMAVNGGAKEYPDAESPTGSEKEELYNAAGAGAEFFAERLEAAWRCVCGRINPIIEEKCARCMRGREECLTEFTREAHKRGLRRLPDVVFDFGPEPELPFLREFENKRMLRERNTLVRRTVTALILALALAIYAFGFHGRQKINEPAPPVLIEERE